MTINLLAGTYHLDRPIVLTSEDSRKEGETLTITNFGNQKVTISGGQSLNLEWESYRNCIWRAKLSQDLVFYELIVNGELQRIAFVRVLLQKPD